MGLRFVYQRMKLACEPAAATPVAALLAEKIRVAGSKGVVALISGGNIDEQLLALLMDDSTEYEHPWCGNGMNGNAHS